MRIGVVLGAGGVVGHAFHAGVLSAIEETTGWDPRRADVIVGTSAGSIVGAMLRAGFSAADLASRVRQQPLSPAGATLEHRAASTTSRSGPAASAGRSAPIAAPARLRWAVVEPWRIRPGSVAAAMMPAGRRSTEPVRAPFRGLFGTDWPADPLWITAVELDRGRRVVFGRGGAPAASVPDAVAASCAIPGYFQPVAINGVRYVDGGAHTPTNADVLVGERLDVVLVSSPMSTGRRSVRFGLDLPIRGILGVTLAAEVAALRGAGPR